MEEWRARLEAGDADGAWAVLIDGHHALIRAVIARLVRDDDDALDAFAHICESLCRDDFARLRRFRGDPRVKFSTWLVVVVRHLTIDWLRARDGRPRLTAPPGVTDLQQRIYASVLVARHSHVEAYELLGARDAGLSFGDFLREVAATYRAVDGQRWSHLARRGGGISPVEEANSEPDVDLGETDRRVRDALSILSADEREAIRLFVVEERPAAEVARSVGWTNAKAVYNRVRRALAAVRRAAGRQEGP